MANAVALQPANSLDETPPNFTARLAALPARSKMAMGGGVVALIAVVLAMTLWSSQGDYKVLYANLSDKDGGAIIAALSQMNVPYRYADGGSAILVPSSKVHDARLRLASAGLPKGSVVGFELMDGARFGQTQFQERLTYQRGLEGELTRSITALAAVQSARVHLAIPNQNGFFREQQKPTASVMLTLYPGRTLDRAQVAGIVHLVSSSVSELNPKAVSVLDQTGTLLSGADDASGNGGLDDQQLAYVAQVEASYAKRITDLLDPVVGRSNLRANVTAQIDFSQTEATTEEFKPNQGAAAASASVRSQQTNETSGGGAGAGAQPSGVPGASSNQPPVAATAPLTGASQPLQTTQNGTGGSGGGASSRREATTNFEVDKTVRVTRNATGMVKRLNAAVVVNNPSTTDAKGKVTAAPMTPEELEKLTSLVRESIGFNQDRGDSVKVINAPFKVEPNNEVALPLWKQPEVLDLLRVAMVPAALVAVAALVFFGMIRPALRAATAPTGGFGSASGSSSGSASGQQGRQAGGPGGQLDAVVENDLTLPGAQGLPALESPKDTNRLDNARAIAKANPAAVAGIVRGWVNGQPA